jgi:hypothetical protein
MRWGESVTTGRFGRPIAVPQLGQNFAPAGAASPHPEQKEFAALFIVVAPQVSVIPLVWSAVSPAWRIAR